MSKETHRDRWISEVFRTPLLSAEVKVFLLFLERYYMDSDGRVCEPRDDLAEALECHPRKVTAKFNMAIQGGLMEQTVRGQKGRTAAYRAIVPGTPNGSQGASTRHPETSRQGASTRHADGVQGAGFYHPEAASQGAGTRPPEDVQGASTRHPETDAHSKDRARARSKRGDRNLPAHAEADDSRQGGVVVKLFDEKIAPSLRSQTPASAGACARKPDRFPEFWAAYPRKVAKGAARKAWAKAIKKADPEHIIWGARRYATDPRRQAADIRYTAHAATWLSAERWTDEDEPLPLTPAADPRQQATDDLFADAMQRARTRDAQEGHR